MGESHRQSHPASPVDQTGDRNNRYVRAANGKYNGSRPLDQQDVTPTQVKTPARTRVMPVKSSKTPTNPPIVNDTRSNNMSTLSVNAIDKSAFLKVILVMLSYILPGYIGYLVIRNFIFFPASMAGLAKFLGFSIIGA